MDLQDRNGCTALMHAVSSSKVHLIQSVLQFQPNVILCNNHNRTAFDHILENDLHERVIRKLLIRRLKAQLQKERVCSSSRAAAGGGNHVIQALLANQESKLRTSRIRSKRPRTFFFAHLPVFR